ncbi:MAG: hypothetical protein UY99_C0014G0020 [Parcubacteria group bacterium GW2011_GWA1_59_11]|nr:MAG: hypothetical protein UY99_C0014G0020 [Parcubacteria group bacterium GW2011_GWA1_59_11]
MNFSLSFGLSHILFLELVFVLFSRAKGSGG